MAKYVSDESVSEATGKDWEGWFTHLDAAGAPKLTHPQIVKSLEPYIESHWWRQTVTGHYERARLGRGKGQMEDGYQISASATLDGDIETVEREWMTGQGWPVGKLVMSTHNPGKNIRGAWHGSASGRITFGFAAQSNGKTRLSLQHSKIETEDKAETTKAAWKSAIADLKARL